MAADFLPSLVPNTTDFWINRIIIKFKKKKNLRRTHGRRSIGLSVIYVFFFFGYDKEKTADITIHKYM